MVLSYYIFRYQNRNMKIRCCISFLIISIIGYGQPASTGLLRQKAMTLRRFLELNHYQPLQWNDTTSGRLYDKWIDRLDDEKLFFTQGDISSLESFRNRLDDELKGTGWDFFNRSITIYKTRVQKADSIIQSILSKPIDLSKPDNFTCCFICNNIGRPDPALAALYQMAGT